MLEGRNVGRLEGWNDVILLSNIPTFQHTVAAQDTIPPGYGTLRRDDVVMRFSTGTVEIQVLPLDEQVIRLLAPDTYRSLSRLVQSRTDDIAEPRGAALRRIRRS